jgi:uncharacterized protein YndB with AHSA1/START domain
MNLMTKPTIDIVIYIGASPDKVWQALTNPEITHRYWFGTRFESDWKVGSPIIWRRDGRITDEQTLLRLEPPRVLSFAFHPVSNDEYRREPPSKVTLELQAGAGGAVTRLTLIHDEFPEGSAVHRACTTGWPQILSSLKTLLETGQPLPQFD